jgi:UDP-2-acetamido-2-deoxy-ribo-hexuluronate aminotransferase
MAAVLIDGTTFATTNERAFMQFIDLMAQQARIRPEIERRMKAVLDHGQYVMGPEVVELEERLAAYVGAKHCIGVANGTDALLIALMALEIRPGDEIITTPFTFIATGEMIRLIGAVPVFVDIEPRTYNIDPSKIEAAITERTRAIMPVSLYGHCADMAAINAIAAAHGLPVIEDAAQSFGATRDGRRSCALSTIGCTSFFPSKPLGAYGDAGACFTDDDELAKRMREIRVHGQDRRYHHPIIGINGRLDTLQAAILLVKMDLFPEELELRQSVAERYNEGIAPLLGTEVMAVPVVEEGCTSAWAQYTLRVADRPAIEHRLQQAGIPTAVHYPIPLNRQPALRDENARVPEAERAGEQVISLPMHPYLTAAEQSRVIAALQG